MFLFVAFFITNEQVVRAEGLQISIADYKNAPFPHESRKNGRVFDDLTKNISVEHYQSSRIAVMLPEKLEKKNGAVNIVFHIHGQNANIEDLVFIDLVSAAFDGAYGDATDTVLIAPQFALNAEDNGGGKLEEENGLERLLIEIFERNGIAAKIGDITIVAYSGGYANALRIIEKNKDLSIKTVVFLDTLYWDFIRALEWYWAGEGRRLFVICGQEPESRLALNTMGAILNNETDYVQVSEEIFLASEIKNAGLFVISTKKSHEDVPKMLGPFLKKIRQ